MFLKKEDDLLIEYFDNEKRGSFRVRPSSKEPVDLSIGNDKYRVKDLGAGGVAIYCGSKEKRMEVGGKYAFKMGLPIINEIISGMIRVVDISDDAYHCGFFDLDEGFAEKIHHFVLERQKEELREKKQD